MTKSTNTKKKKFDMQQSTFDWLIIFTEFTHTHTFTKMTFNRIRHRI